MIAALPSIIDLLILFGAALLAGTVRGFVGFGTALIFLPMAALVFDPVQAITALVAMDLIGPLPALPSAAKHADRRDLLRLLTGVVIALPLGLWTLFVLPGDIFRWVVSVVALVMLTGLILGWRYRGVLSPRLIFGTGISAGYLGGVAGIPGPPVIFIYMASPLPVATIRANVTFFLLFYDWIMLAVLAGLDRLESSVFVLGLALIVPNMVGNFVGTKLFRPERERLYRRAAYGIIGVSALAGIPVFGLGN